MTFTVFDVISWAIVYLSYFIVAKIVIRDKTFYIKEVIYIIAACLLMALFAVIGIAILRVGGAISGIVSLIMCTIYFYKIKSYTIVKTITLTLISFRTIWTSFQPICKQRQEKKGKRGKNLVKTSRR